MKGKIFFLLIPLALYFPFASCTVQDNATDPHEAAVTEERRVKDSTFRTNPDHPIPAAGIAGFTGLSYYPYDMDYRVTAKVEKIKDPVVFKMKTSSDRTPDYRTYARVHFTLQGIPCTLMVYQNMSLLEKPEYHDYLFLPFTDETSGRETYGGGRFLELTIPAGDTMTIDFNQAFNPYCAYNERYSCPIPPAENDLSVAIRAGEKPWKAGNTGAKH